MAKQSAGLVLYRHREGKLEVLLVHPGGPLWARKDEGAWSIPKGEFEPGEDPLEAAQREFYEETGYRPEGPFRPLGEVRQAGGKRVVAWACEGNWDPQQLRSNTFQMEWPPRSGKICEFPEVDRAEWFKIEDAQRKIVAGQRPLLERLAGLLGAGCRESGR